MSKVDGRHKSAMIIVDTLVIKSALFRTLVIVLLAQGNAWSNVSLPRLISNGLVLQRDVPVHIWGWAEKGERVKVSFIGKSYETITADDGAWLVTLDRMKAGGPHTLIIEGQNHLEVNNVLIGDVWVCSGQSNMELPMERVKEKYREVINEANHQDIRQFIVPKRYNFNQAEKDVQDGKWTSASPVEVLSFSAVAYFFALELHNRHNVPIGLINASLGGSPAEAWMSEDALSEFPELLREGQRFKDNALIREIDDADRLRADTWYKELNTRDKGLKKWNQENIDDNDWETFQLPGYWSDTQIGNVNGAVWFRRRIDISPAMAGKAGHLWMGRIVDADSVFLNGKFIGTTGYQYPPRRYQFPGGVLKPGVNTIAVRVINPSGRGGFVSDKPYFLAVGSDTISLRGTWKYKLGTTMEPLPGQTFIRWKPFGLYNGVIAPIIHISIKGVIWYQGEANTSRAKQYEKLFPKLIENWRNKWNIGNFPFLFVQLANFMEPRTTPGDSQWAELREAQRKTLDVSPNTAMIVAIDAGEWNDIHPLDKQTIGKRLALQAQRVAYGKRDVITSGPLFKSSKLIGNKIELTFSDCASGLVSRNGPLKYFAIAGTDKKFVWAKAKITGNNKVIVWHERIAKPEFVRYGWADNPEGANLYNSAGLPASPFETN